MKIFDLFLKIRKISSEEKILIFIFFFLGIFLIIFGIKNIKTNLPVTPKYGGIYREGLYEEIDSFDIFNPKNDSQKAVLNIIFPPLIEFENGQIVSKFIKNYSISSDYLTYNFELKENLKWSDGSNLTSEDILRGFELLKKYGPKEITNLFNDINFQLIDRKKFSFILKTNNNYFLNNLKHLRPLPPNNFEDLAKINISSGPFFIEKYQKNEGYSILTLKRNEYFQPRPYLEKVVFIIYPSPKRAFDGLLLKEIDGLAGINYFNLPSNIFNRFNIYKINLPRVIGLFFNSKNYNKNFYSYLEKNIDRSFIVKKIFYSFAEESLGLFSPSIRKLLKIEPIKIESNDFSKDFQKEKVIVPDFYFYPEIARYFRDQFNLEIEFVSEEELKQIIKNKDYNIILMGINYSWLPAPFYFFSQAGFNLNNQENINLEKKFQRLISEPNINFSQTLAEIEKNILESKNNIFLINPNYLYLIDKNFYGFNEFFLSAPEERFVKISKWFRK